MRQVYISLPTTEKVQKFVKTISNLEGDFELVSGKHILEARSLMGIFSLDLTKPILLRVYADSPDTISAIEEFVVAIEEV